MDLHVAAIKPNSQKETLIPNMIKCRTCLEQADECTSVNIVTECTLGRTIKDILLLFIPGMVTSPLIGEFICCKCTRRIRNFTNFIEKCLSVEKILIEENAKAQKEIIKQSAPVSNSVNTPLSLVYITVPQVNQNGVQNGAAPLQPIQIKSIPLKFILQPTNPTALGNDVMPVSQIAHQNTSQNQFIIVPEIKSCSVDTSVGLQPQINSNHSIQIDKTELNHSPQKRKQSDLISSATGNRFCRTCGDVFMSNDWSMIECSKCATTEKDIEMNLSDVPSNYFDNGDDSNDLEMTVEKDSNTQAKEADLMKEADNVFKNLRSEFRDTIISVRQPSEQIDKILEEFTKSNIKIIEYGPYNHTENKRIMFLGNSSSQCSECKVLLKNPKALKVHFQDAHTKQELNSEEEEDEDVGSKKTFQCPFCDVTTATPLLLVGHLRVMHRVENPFMCEKCSKTFRKRDIYLEHIKRYENSPDCSLRKCRFCEEMLNKGQLEKHLKSHRNLVCDQCGKSFSGVNTFKAHYATHQGDDEKSEIKTKTEHLCPICGKLLSNVQSYKHHITTHEQRTRNYICHMCPKTFLTLHYLKSHITKSHVDRKIVCTICGIKVKTRGALINHHNLKHAETYAHECNICGKGFSRGDYYKRHMKRHAGPSVGRGPGKKKYNYSVKIESKPVKCKYCLKIFKNVYLLRSHLLSHVKNMRYKCKFCDMTLANTATRFRHQKRHADPNFDLSCTICWRRMDNKEKLQAHLSVHEQSKRYKCTECNELFCSKYLLRHHISEQHIAKEEIEMEKEIVLSNALEEFLL